MLVLVEILGIVGFGARPRCARRRRIAGRREQRAIVAVVVINACGIRSAAGQSRQQAGKRIRRFGGESVGVRGSVLCEPSQMRSEVAGDASREVDGMKAVDANQQNMLDVMTENDGT